MEKLIFRSSDCHLSKADDESRYLTDPELLDLSNRVPEISLILKQVKLLRDEAPNLVTKARERLLAKFPNITEPGGDLYPPERAEACWRDFWHFLRCITYGITGKSTQFTSQKGLKNMQLLYEELQVPLGAMIYGLEQLKAVSLEQFNPQEQELLSPYFDHLVKALKQFT